MPKKKTAAEKHTSRRCQNMIAGYGGTRRQSPQKSSAGGTLLPRISAASTSEDVKRLRPNAPNPFDQHPAVCESYLSYKYFKNLGGLEERVDRGL